MTNNNKEEKKETMESEPNPIIESNEPPQEQKSRSCSKSYLIIPGVACIGALAAIIIALYSINLNNSFQNNLITANKNLTAEVEELKQKHNSVQEDIATKAQSLQHMQSTLESKVDGLNKELQTAMQQRLYQNQDWLLLKARYYLELAQINEHWSDNFNAAIALLQEADKLLQQINTPKIFTVRQAIAKEMAQLKSVPKVDIAGLLSQLDAAQVSVSNLTIQSTIAESGASAETETPKAATPQAWRARFQDSLNLLEKLVVIRRTDEEIKPLMSPLFESILRESIRLNLQEAQWAILNNNDAVYQMALKQAIVNLKRTFDEQERNTAELIKQLNTLQQVKLRQEKPITGLALPLLNQMIDNKELPGNQTDTGGKGESKQ
ncbi:uroporphyrinogen-III C-methyltransferase [Legionella shakespearei]|uniref:Uroporphyrinogen III methylase n=1 Tax=Legionella shakespearei DSM 23087 TaxID=1122169 RepID=A0A0W0YTR9_9GAMM|nr:uroporphyrinogen-III C-methyltransferase [Legionella shakespearei]KTD59939.1 uroporphyrinogen III methylase [Legionella shakespearei DSM 23087]